VAGEDGAGPHPAQVAVEREDCPVPAGETGEVGDSAVPPYMHLATGIKGEEMYVQG